MRPGEQSVMDSGLPMMLTWLAGSLDFHHWVYYLTYRVKAEAIQFHYLQELLHGSMPSLVRELVLSGLMTCSALEVSVDL